MDFEDLKNLVIDRGLCTGCGSCIGFCGHDALEVSYEFDEPIPKRIGKCLECGVCTSVCPGGEVPIPDLDKFCFGRTRQKSEILGIFQRSVSGHALEEKVRVGGSSGGVATALLLYALENGVIDCALVTGFNKEAPWRTEALLVTKREEVMAAAQSKMAMAATNSLLHKATKAGYKKIGIIGLPCHIHGIRKAQCFGAALEITGKIEFLIGLLCGSEFYFEGTKHLLAEWCGVESLSDIRAIQYRGGDWPGDFIVDLANGERRRVERHLYITQVFHNYIKDRCLMCLDWSSELADVSLGDYWNPERKRGDLGKTTMLMRTSKGIGLVEAAQRSGYIAAESCTTELLIGSTAFERKKHANALRIKQRQRFGWPAPRFGYSQPYAPLPLIKRHTSMPNR